MHWDKSPPTVLAGSRPYQGVRVRDPVKELLRRKRSLEPQSAKTASATVAAAAPNDQPSYSRASIFGVEAARGTSTDASNSSGNGGLHSAGWRGQSAMAPWPTSDYTQVGLSYAQSLTYPTNPTTLTADVYMQTLCPSYTLVGPPAMLTYTHTPLIANFGTVTGAPPLASTTLQVDFQDPGLAYIPWAQPLATMPTMTMNSGVQFTTCSTTLPTSPLVHMPSLHTPLTAMIPQLEAQSQPAMEHLPDQHLNAEPQPQPLDASSLKLDEVDLHHVVQPESPNPLERLLEDTPAECDEEAEDAYNSTLFRLNV